MLILGDARVRNLENTIASNEIKVFHMPGATWIRLLNEFHDAIDTLRPKYLLLICGMCDLTIVDTTETGLVVPRHSNKAQLTTYMHYQLMDANTLARNSYPFSRIIFGDVCSMHLETYNFRHNRHDDNPLAHILDLAPLQTNLNFVVQDLNETILTLNYFNGVPHPYLSRRVHKVSRFRATQHNYHLLRKGLLPGRALLSHWARRIRKLYRELAGVEPSSALYLRDFY